MKKQKVSVYTDDEFPGVFFLDTPDGLYVAKPIAPRRCSQRNITAFFFRTGGRQRYISEQAVRWSIDHKRTLLESRSKLRYYQPQFLKDKMLLDIMRLRRDVNLPADYMQYFDDAVVALLSKGQKITLERLKKAIIGAKIQHDHTFVKHHPF